MSGENTFHQYHGVIRSPQGQNKIDQGCTWKIILPPDHRITLNFTAFHMNYEYDQENDRDFSDSLEINSQRG